MANRVFVYGTLMRGHRLNPVLPQSGFVREAQVRGYEMYDMGAYPAAVEGTGAVIHGELWEVDDLKLQELDWIEGPYHRTPTVVDDEPAWIYLWAMGHPADAGCRRIHDGRWSPESERAVSRSGAASWSWSRSM